MSVQLPTGVFQSPLELVNTSADVNKFLLTGKEGVAFGADFYPDLAALCGLGGYGFSASATDYAIFILRMDSVFHVLLPRFFHSDVL